MKRITRPGNLVFVIILIVQNKLSLFFVFVFYKNFLTKRISVLHIWLTDASKFEVFDVLFYIAKLKVVCSSGR
jgi:hypothetical protein